MVETVGMQRRKIPAPPISEGHDDPLSELSGWREVFGHHAARSNPGFQDHAVLHKLGYPEKEDLLSMAFPSGRVTDEPGWSHGIDDEAHAFNGYLSQFGEMVENLKKLRALWLDLVPLDDPMRYDERALRSAENMI